MPIDPIPASVASLLNVFEADLPDVRFADLDRAALELAADRVRQSAAQLVNAEEAADAARRELAGAQAELAAKGQRALAYARIYAQSGGSTELIEKLAAIALPASRGGDSSPGALDGASAAPRRRGRPPKAATLPGFTNEGEPSSSPRATGSATIGGADGLHQQAHPDLAAAE